VLKDVIERIEKEGEELNQKYIKLCKFLDSPSSRDIGEVHRTLLGRQKMVMKDYLYILEERVGLLKIELMEEK